ncbi:hypothetical protein CTA1_11824 [Colletotrichum tanaceti]|uniref:Uncharacterized protein n=1 Tax=Colletotrichum tanaceti TaxID=1306861 RepID=A0A4U6X677_9PEZI|nr:hypothetical protein CTA1_11824 [Colletotrichum tanaceti]
MAALVLICVAQKKGNPRVIGECDVDAESSGNRNTRWQTRSEFWARLIEVRLRIKHTSDSRRHSWASRNGSSDPGLRVHLKWLR